MINGSGTERSEVSRVTLRQPRDGTTEEQEEERNIQIPGERARTVLSEDIAEESRSIGNTTQDAGGHHGGANDDGRDWRSYRERTVNGGREGIKAKPAPRITLVADVWHPDLTKGLALNPPPLEMYFSFLVLVLITGISKY